MTKLWAEEGGTEARALRAETLTKKLGGVQQIAREHVDRILDGLTAKEQALCADIFRNLVTSSGSKIAYPTNDLARQISEDRKQAREGRTEQIVAADDVDAVLRKLTPTGTRLLKPVKKDGVDAFELFHDVLGEPVSRWRRDFKANALLRAEQRRARRARWLAAVMSLVTIVAIFATGVAYVQTVGVQETVGKNVWGVLELPQYSLKSWDIDGLWRITELNGDQRDGFLAPLTGRYDHRGPVARFAAWASGSLLPRRLQLLEDAQPDPNMAERLARRPVAVLRALGLRRLTDAQVQAATAAILAAIKQTTEPNQLRELAQALKALDAKLTDTQAQAAILPILSVIRRTTDVYATKSLTEALQALPAKLNDAQAQAAIDSVLASIKRQKTNAFEIWTLVEALNALPAKLTDAQAQAAFDPIIAAMKMQRVDAVWGAGLALKTLATRLTDAQAQAAFDPILSAIKQTNDPTTLGVLEQALEALATKLTDAQAQAAIEPALAAITQISDANNLHLAQMRALAAKLTGAQAQAALGPLLAAIMQTTDPSALQALALTLKSLVTKLTDAQAEAGIDPILAALKQTTDLDAKLAMAQALQALPAKLTDAQAQDALDPILSAISRNTDLDDLRYQVAALQAVAAKLTDAQAQAAIDPILAAIKQTADPDTLGLFAQALQALATKLGDAQTPELLPRARLYLATAGDENSEKAWTGSIAALAARERDDKAFLGAIVEVLKYPTAAGNPTDALMTALRQRFPDVPELKGGLDAAVPWLEEQLGADVVARPPVRPK